MACRTTLHTSTTPPRVLAPAAKHGPRLGPVQTLTLIIATLLLFWTAQAQDDSDNDDKDPYEEGGSLNSYDNDNPYNSAATNNSIDAYPANSQDQSLSPAPSNNYSGNSNSIAPSEPVMPEFNGSNIETNPYEENASLSDNANVSILPQNPTTNIYNSQAYSNEEFLFEQGLNEGTDPMSNEGNPINSSPQNPANSHITAPEDSDASAPDPDPIPKIRLQSITLPNEFAGAPPVPGTLGVLEIGEAPSHYVIQEGDTLFDICDQLLSEASYWPKLWALNPEIRNPHYIWPGMVLRFYPGDDFLPPFLEIQEAESLAPIALGQDYEVEDLLVAKLPEQIAEEVIKYTPAKFQFAEWNDISPMSSEDLIADEPDRLMRSIKTRLPFFIYKSRPKALGTVIGTFHAKSSTIQEGMLRTLDSMEEGSTYSVIRLSHRMYHPKKFGAVGFLYNNVGTIRTQKVESERNTMSFVSTNLWSYILPDDLIVDLKPSRYSLPFSSKRHQQHGQDADATVVSVGLRNAQIAGSGYFIVFDNTSLPMGGLVSLYNLRTLSQSSSRKQPHRYGVARVVNVSDAGTIAYVVHAHDTVRIGDRSDTNF